MTALLISFLCMAAAEPIPPFACKMKAVAGPMELKINAKAEFRLHTELEGRSYVCKLEPLKFTDAHGVIFKPTPKCEPKKVPDYFPKYLSAKMEWFITDQSTEFFLEEGEPSLTCLSQGGAFDHKKTVALLELLKKKHSSPR